MQVFDQKKYKTNQTKIAFHHNFSKHLLAFERGALGALFAEADATKQSLATMVFTIGLRTEAFKADQARVEKGNNSIF